MTAGSSLSAAEEPAAKTALLPALPPTVGQSPAELLKSFVHASNRRQLVTLAIALGNLDEKRFAELPEEDSKQFKALVNRLVLQLGDFKTQGEARELLEGLWHRAASELILHGSEVENGILRDNAAKLLCLMQDERIVRELVEHVRKLQSPAERGWGVFALGTLRDRRRASLPQRQQIDEREQTRLANDIVRPFLESLQQSESDAGVLKIINFSLTRLDAPLDTRPQIVAPAPTPVAAKNDPAAQDAPSAPSAPTSDRPTETSATTQNEHGPAAPNSAGSVTWLGLVVLALAVFGGIVWRTMHRQ